MTNPIHHYTPSAWQGDNYKSGRDITDIAKAIRKELKDHYYTNKCKWSVRIERYSGGRSLNISLMEGPFEAIKAVRRESFAGGEHKFIIEPVKEQYAQINHYHLDNYSNEDEWAGVNNGYVLHEDAIKALKHATKFANSFNFDDSDSQIDYFHTNFYLHINIGMWNKPFVNSNYIAKKKPIRKRTKNNKWTFSEEEYADLKPKNPVYDKVYVREFLNQCNEECGKCSKLDACFEKLYGRPAPKNPVSYEDYSI